MAGQLVDAQPEQEDFKFDSVEDKSDSVTEDVVEENNTNEEEVPEKYKGKSFKDIVQMHQEAEKAIGKQGNEVGELRKLVDDHIRSQLEQRQEAPKQEVPEDPVDWFSDPDAALEQRLNNHPRIKEAEQTSKEYQKQQALDHLQRKHADMNEILADPSFAQWVKGTKTRQKLFVQADQQYDYDAADELFQNWKDLGNAKSTATAVDKELQKEQVKAASTGSQRGTNPPARKKKYRRADIQRLRVENPDRYNEMADEFLHAYREGRVIT